MVVCILHYDYILTLIYVYTHIYNTLIHIYRGRPVPVHPQGHTERDGQEDQHRPGEAAEHTQ